MNSSSSVDIIYCSKCGGEMKRTARYCMKCGNLNFDHPDNDFMKRYTDSNVKDGVFISGEASVNNKSTNQFKACFLINLVIHILLGFICLIPTVVSTDYLRVSIVGIVAVCLLFLFNYSFQCVYIKANKTWWSYFVPFYGNYVFFEISMSFGWWFVVTFIPVIGTLINFVAYYKLGKKFYKSGILTMLFPFVMIPIIGLDKKIKIINFDQQSNLEVNQVDKHGKTKTERDYGRNKLFLSGIILIVLGIVMYFVWPYIEAWLDKITV